LLKYFFYNVFFICFILLGNIDFSKNVECNYKFAAAFVFFIDKVFSHKNLEYFLPKERFSVIFIIIMDRNKQGIVKKSEDEEPPRENIFEKTPSLKIIILLIIFSCVLFTCVPNGRQILDNTSGLVCHFVCNFDSSPNENGGSEGGPDGETNGGPGPSGNAIPVNNTTPEEPKITEEPKKSGKKILL
jgi:hypothetical protein